MKRNGGDGPYPIRVGRGSRVAEAALLDEIQFLAEAGERDPSLLGLPVRVVVPSTSLRAHVAAALLRRRGRAVAGVLVQTLRGLALEVLERSGEVPHCSEALFPVVVRRLARQEPVLRRDLDELVDGYGIVAENVTDLLDAGFTPAHVDALGDAASELAAHPTLVARTEATLRVAAGTVDALDELGVGHRSRLLEQARLRLERAPASVLPARAVLIHGFAEATGLGAELLETLVRHRSARVYADAPPDPANPSAADGVWRFSQRLQHRLAGVAGTEPVAHPEPTESAVVVWKGSGAQAEVRAVAAEIRELLDAGHRPESIGVVARDLSAYRAPLREHFTRFGIPFSGVGEIGSVGAARRRVRALLDLLQRRGRVPADRWLDAVIALGTNPGGGGARERREQADLRLGLRHVGAVRLEDVAQFERAKGDIRLPVVGAFRDHEDAGRSDRRAEPRRLQGTVFDEAVRAAKRTLIGLGQLAAAGDARACIDRAWSLLVDALGWEPDRSECAAVFESLVFLRTELPPTFALQEDEFLLVLRRAWERVGVEPIGGAGGGVQILSVMEARARTFDALYMLGLNRDVFPRTIHQDPLLPDTVRRALGGVLPDLPIKATGHEEERYLFAQMLSASPRVTLSWQAFSDNGRERAASTFVERLMWGPREIPTRELAVPNTPDDVGVVGAAGFAVRAGLFASRADFSRMFSVAMAEICDGAGATIPGPSPEDIARGRLVVLAEFDRPPSVPARIGPYDGFIGRANDTNDPRCRPIYITTVENVARCPWQAFLARLLRLQPPPDPLAVLPGSDPRLLGMVVHRTLEQVVRAKLAAAPETMESISPAAIRDDAVVAVAWPGREVLEAALLETAVAVLADEGIGLRGLARILVDQARPYVERAGALDWPGVAARVNVVGVEVEGSVAGDLGSGGFRELRFRADRVDSVDGTLRITDYKTGAPISNAVRAETRIGHFRAAVAEGRHLQAVAYARGAPVEDASGRFLFLRPDLDAAAATYEVRAEEPEINCAFEDALERIGTAWEQGAFGPRLLDSTLQKENAACERCDLAVACLRGDSGTRGRLRRWLEGAGGVPLKTPERALLEVWRLQAAKALSDPGESV